MRPANIITAVADILAGVSVAGFLWRGGDWWWLILATIGLYGGGVVFNDIFDADLDRVERPERPIPSGQVTVKQATALGMVLLLAGIACAFLVSIASGFLATAVALLAIIYDKYGKHHSWLGPLNMGACRGGNLLLGISFSLLALQQYWWLALIPVVFISDITLTSQGEVTGRNRRAIQLALGLDWIVLGAFVALHFFTRFNLMDALLFLVLWTWMNTGSKLKAIRRNEPALIMRAVKMGVLSLIPLNAALSAGFSGILAGLIVLCLLPVSLGLARLFAVT
jgi:4-hydroxybenzoate polyprenyltransferase